MNDSDGQTLQVFSSLQPVPRFMLVPQGESGNG